MKENVQLNFLKENLMSFIFEGKSDDPYFEGRSDSPYFRKKI